MKQFALNIFAQPIKEWETFFKFKQDPLSYAFKKKTSQICLAS